MAGKPKLLLLLDVDGTIIYALKKTQINEQGEEEDVADLHYVYGENIWHETLLELKEYAEATGVELIVGLVSNKPYIDDAIIKLLTEFDPDFFCAFNSQLEAIPRNSSDGFVYIVDVVNQEFSILKIGVNEYGECEEILQNTDESTLFPTIILRDLGEEWNGEEYKSAEIFQLANILGIPKEDIIFVDDRLDIIEEAKVSAGTVFHLARENPQQKDSLPYLVCYQENEESISFSAQKKLDPLREIIKAKIALMRPTSALIGAGRWRKSQTCMDLQAAGELKKTYSI